MRNNHDRVRSFRLKDEDDRNLEEIFATGCFDDDSEAMRFSLRVCKILIKHLIDGQVDPTLYEMQSESGMVSFIEKWNLEEIRAAFLLLRSDIGPGKFDAMLAKAKKRREWDARDRSYVEKAKAMLRAHAPGPYSYEEIVDAVKKASWDRGNTIGLDYAKEIVRKQRQAGRIVSKGPAQYDFLEEEPVASVPRGGD